VATRVLFDDKLWHQWENATGAGGPFFREAVSAHRPVFLSRRLPPSPLFPAAPCTARRKIQAPHPWWARARTDGLLAPRNSGGIAAPKGRRCKVPGARRVGARSPPSRRSRV